MAKEKGGIKVIKEQIIISLKMVIGVVVATLIAKALNLEFYSSVATIVIVSMLSTKKQSIKLAGILLIAAIFSLALASFLFTIFGFSLSVFAVYILIFTFLMHRFDTKSAIITNVVLVMQIYSLETISVTILLNQFARMFIGLSVALVLNIFTLDFEDELIEYQKQVETLLNSIFHNMGRCLNNEGGKELIKEELEELDKLLSKARIRSYDYLNSFYIEQNNYYVEYFIMRRQQYYTLVSMQKFIELKFLNRTEVNLLRDFTDNFVNNTRIFNTCQLQMERLDEIKHHFTQTAELPSTKIQLQNRIALHQYLYGLVNLVELKMRFIENYEKKD